MLIKKPMVVNGWPTNREKPTIWHDGYRHMADGRLVKYKSWKRHVWAGWIPHIDARNGQLMWYKMTFETFEEAVVTVEFKIKLANVQYEMWHGPKRKEVQ
jgi:hypothetical protein